MKKAARLTPAIVPPANNPIFGRSQALRYKQTLSPDEVLSAYCSLSIPQRTVVCAALRALIAD